MINIAIREIEKALKREFENDKQTKLAERCRAALQVRENVDALDNLFCNRDFSAHGCMSFFIMLSGEQYDSEFPTEVYNFLVRLNFPKLALQYNTELEADFMVFLRIYRVFCEFEKRYAIDKLYIKHPINTLPLSDMEHTEDKKEYLRFSQAFNGKYVYELMRLSQDVTPFNTLDHISGVYGVAMNITMQLSRVGVPVAVGRVAGAAACHDIGKYACIGENTKRVPYLHYYFSDIWYKENKLFYMGNVAVNHSTWDLELETLSLESLILIYADFRVKNKKNEDGKYQMHIYPLDQSFDVILAMLDNVDKQKEDRYRRVYAKLHDFENYLKDLGIAVDPFEKGTQAKLEKATVFLKDDEIIDKYKHLAIEKNIFLMSLLGTEEGFSNILDNAASETQGKILRSYLNILDEYYPYLESGQKVFLLGFLYNLLVNKDEDVRNHAAELMGKIIGSYDEEYRKEIPSDVEIETFEVSSVSLFEKYLHMMLMPDHKTVDLHVDWTRLNLKIMVRALFRAAPPKVKQQLFNTFEGYVEHIDSMDDTARYLMQCIKHINLADFEGMDISILLAFIGRGMASECTDMSLLTIDSAKTVYHKMSEHDPNRKALTEMIAQNDRPCVQPLFNFLKHKIYKNMAVDKELTEKYSAFETVGSAEVEALFLSNLKSATGWTVKKANIDIAVESENTASAKTSLQTAMHLCNLLKVSATETVRNHAGRALVEIMKSLTSNEKNEICVELTSALEMQEYQFTRYIPEYLGQILNTLLPNELNEMLRDIKIRIKVSQPQLTMLLLRTVGYCLKHYENYDKDGNVKDYEQRLLSMLGMLLNGVFSYDKYVKHEAFRIIGREVFAAKTISIETKAKIFTMIGKKLLYAISKMTETDLVFINFSASLNSIYRFILAYEFKYGQIKMKTTQKAAFFPGTFDPFTLSHKQIATCIRDMGFAVYLAVDEFSWSKRTQPNSLRRAIMEMSVADELDIYIYPENEQINIASSKDLKRLAESFGDESVYMVVGSDVVRNASAYRENSEDFSIQNFNHVIFERSDAQGADEKYLQALSKIEGNVQRLTLPTEYKDISSTLIREYIDKNNDISQFVDLMAQKFIYEMGLYIKEQQNKKILRSKLFDITVKRSPDRDMLHKLVDELYGDDEDYHKGIETLDFSDVQIVVCVREADTKKLRAFSILHWLKSSMYYSHFKDHKVCNEIREQVTGRIALIRGLFLDMSVDNANIEQILLTETLTECIVQDYTYAVYKPLVRAEGTTRDMLTRQGFLRIEGQNPDNDVHLVNMASPCILFLDFMTILKEPFNSNATLIGVVERMRNRLQLALTKLYRGDLVLSFDNDVLIDKLIEMVCAQNEVPSTVCEPRVLGEKMCVPYGSVLNGSIIPNTVTKSLHSEKMYEADLKKFEVTSTPYYLGLESQINMLSSFERPIILIDDLLHRGHRIESIDPLLKKQNINVDKLIVSILTGRGKEMMDMQDREVSSSYFLPNLKTWFYEKTMYPFTSGDAVKRRTNPKRFMFPSINFILPYAMPIFLQDCDGKDVFNLSKVCIENAISLFKCIEVEYQKIYDKSFTMKQLGEVFVYPCCPDLGENIDYDYSLKPSEYLINDLERLLRIENMVN